MINAKRSKTTDRIDGDNLWLVPQGRSNNPERCVSLNYRSPALPMAIL